MSTPRKNHNHYASPYANPRAQYPSQSEDFLALEIGGPGAVTAGRTSTPAKNNGPAYFYQNKQQHQQAQRGGGNPPRFYGGNNRNSYGDESGGFRQNFQQDRRSSGRGGGWGTGGGRNGNWNNGGGGGGAHQRFRQSGGHKSQDGGNYFHPSMLEDPWRELMERINAIRKSEISLGGGVDSEAHEDEQMDAPAAQTKAE